MANYRHVFIRRDSKEFWEQNNPRLGLGEPGVEMGANPRMKIGNGIDGWNSLPYLNCGTDEQAKNFEESISKLQEDVKDLQDELKNSAPETATPEELKGILTGIYT